MIRYLLSLCLPFTAISAYAEDSTKVPRELSTPNYRVSEITGIGAEPDVERQDPSNVIRVGDTFYVRYTRRKAGVHPYASTVFYATSKDGRNWTEKSEALGKGAADAWDSFENDLPTLLSQLKAACGAGGTVTDDLPFQHAARMRSALQLCHAQGAQL